MTAVDASANGSGPKASGLEISDLRVTFSTRRRTGGRRGTVRAVSGVDLRVAHGETVALVGESGSGKSTVARAICGLVPYEGRITIGGIDLAQLTGRRRREAGRLRQIVFQDPYSSLNPTMRVEDLVAEPIKRLAPVPRREREARVHDLLRLVQLPGSYAFRLPHELSGGQRQRVAIARAIAVNPGLVICDEALSGLDVSTQREVLELLGDLRAKHGVSYLFIAHDLAVVRQISDRVAVMYFGEIVEEGPTAQVFAEPAHPYTRALMSAAPFPDPRRQRERRRILLTGELPDPTAPPRGCAFHPRCPSAMDVCREIAPTPVVIGAGVRVSCHLYDADGAPDRASTGLPEPRPATTSPGRRSGPGGP